MTILGIDPGTAHVGYAILCDAEAPVTGEISIGGPTPWPVRLRSARAIIAQLVADVAPGVVAIEATQVHQGQWERAKTDPKELAGLRSQAELTRQTEELAGVIAELAGLVGARVVRVTPEQGRMRLGVKRGGKDRAYSEAANRMFGLKLLVREHHQARALGVGLQAQTDARIERCKP